MNAGDQPGVRYAGVSCEAGAAADPPRAATSATASISRRESDSSLSWRCSPYSTTTPPMPGHPDWTVDPVGAAAARSLAAAPELPFRAR